MSQSGGFDELNRGGFDDLMPTTQPTANSSFNFNPIDSDNPFADMESSQYITTSILNSGTPPTTFSNDYEDLAENNSPRYEREDAPEPETPSSHNPFYASPHSPSVSIPSASPTIQHRRQQDPSEISALLGDPTPILPTFRSTFKPAFHPVHNDNVLPISSIGHRPVGGHLAALLGLEETAPVASTVTSTPTKPTPTSTPTNTPAAVESLTATMIPLPASATPSRTPSRAQSAASGRTRDSYSEVVSPMNGSENGGGDDTVNEEQIAGDNETGLESNMRNLKVVEEDKPVSHETPDKVIIVKEEDDEEKSEPERTGIISTPAPTTSMIEQAESALAPTSPQSPFGISPQSPFAKSINPESIEDIPALTHSPPSQSDSLFDDPAATSASRGFRSFNDITDDAMNEPDAFASVYHQSEPSAERDTSSGFIENTLEDTRPLPSVNLSEERHDENRNLPPLPSQPDFEDIISSSQASTDATTSLSPSFIIAVGDPQKVGSSLNVASQHTVYTVRTKTTSSAYRKREFSVLRRFSHFLWLFDALTINNPGVIVPGMPEKSALGRFGSDFVENRRSALQSALMKIVCHPMLVGDPDLRLFLESDTFSNDIKQRKVDSPAESKGFLASLGNSISGSKFHEVDEYFDTRRQTLDSFETQLRLLLVSLANSAKLRHTLQTSLGELQAAFIALASCDLSGPLRNALEKAAGLQGKLRESSEAQSTSEEEIGGLTSTAEGYARLCGSVKLVFSSRVKAYNTWQTAESNLRKVRSAHEKAKKAGRTPSELLGISLSEISEAERRSNDAKRDFEDVGKLVKAEMARFDKEKVEDFKKAVEDYADGMVLRQRSVVVAWQEYAEMLSVATGSNVEATEVLAT